MTDKPFDHTDIEVERYELREPKPYVFEATRREFVQTLGAGILITVVVRDANAQRRGRRSARRDTPLSQRFHLGEDGVVTVLTSKVEVGQGSRTQLSQAAAEELTLPLTQVRLIMADTAQCPDDGGTAGSRTTPSTVPRIRNAAAALRDLLSKTAADHLGVDATKLTLEGGVFQTDGQQVSIGELASSEDLMARLKVAPSASGVSIAPVSKWKVLGTSAAKITAHDVVTGAAHYPSDIVREGMLYGKVVRPPAYGSTLTTVNLEPAQSMDGVIAVRDGDFVGCVAPTSWEAEQARDAIAATASWQPDSDDQVSSDDLFDHLKSTAGRSRDRNWGDAENARAKAAHKMSSQYTVAYIQHAPMEPRAAVAEWTDGRLTVWTGSQQPARVHGQLRESFRLPTDRVRVIVPDTGGGFGGKHTGEAAIEAARLAKAAGRPVHLRWTREEEFTWAYFRPAGLIEVEAALDDSGNLISWDFANYNSGGSAIDTPYSVPHGRTRTISADSPLRQGSYRALASTANTFARECAMDELATLAQVDPLEFRLRHLKPGRLKDVLRAAATKFDWQQRVADNNANRGVGIGCGTEKGSYTAACAEVEIADDTIHVVQVCQAFECGAIQNPANLRRQVEGCLMMGLGAALYEAIEFRNGRISNASFSAYQVPRASDLPQLELVLLDRPDLPSVGAGETPIIAIAPAIANAVFNAAGTRCRSLPLSLG